VRIIPPECLCEGATRQGGPSGAALWRALSPVHVVSLVPSEHAGSHDARLLGLCVAVGVVLVVASVVAMKTSQVLSARKRGRSALHRARNLTPEKIVACKGPARAEDTPELLSRRIIERSKQIQCALSAGPSEIEIAMCAMGYSACADDLLALIELVGERFPKSGPVRRLRMRATVRRATDSLALTRRAFPPRARAGPPAGSKDKDAR
jgi:hypothetical protein